jgi:hypothetical protein
MEELALLPNHFLFVLRDIRAVIGAHIRLGIEVLLAYQPSAYGTSVERWAPADVAFTDKIHD